MTTEFGKATVYAFSKQNLAACNASQSDATEAHRVAQEITGGQAVRVVEGLLEAISNASGDNQTFRVAQLQEQGIDSALQQRQGTVDSRRPDNQCRSE